MREGDKQVQLVPEEDQRRFSTQLERLGLSARHAKAYVALLSGPLSADELATDLSIDSHAAGKTLAELLQNGLINRLPGEITRFALAPPEWTMPSLIQQREEEIQDLRRGVHQLAQQFRIAYEEGPQNYVEVFAGKEAIALQIKYLFESAQEESSTFVKAPLMYSSAPGVHTGIARGLKVRALWEREILEMPGMLDAAREWVAAGEQVRVLASLPAKVLMFDRKAALINVTESPDSGVTAGLLTRHPELVATLYRLFDLLWEKAVPLEAAASGEREGTIELNLEERDRFIACLTAGMTDTAIQRAFGISRRTFSRRVRELLDELGAASRFQAGFRLGFEAARRDQASD